MVDFPKVCACGKLYSVNHALICKLGGFVTMRYNWLRDTIGKIMKVVKCKDRTYRLSQYFSQQIDNSCPLAGTVTGDQARLDISARSVWNVLGRAFFDVRVFYAPASTNATKETPAMYLAHETEKKRSYNARVINIEKGTFTPLVFLTTGGMWLDAQRFVKKLAQKMATPTEQKYANSGFSFI